MSEHFQGKPARLRELYKMIVKQARHIGRVTIVPEKTRIAFQVRMSFAAVQVHQAKLTGHLVLAERHEASCFTRIDSISRRNHVHHFQISKPEDLTAELCEFMGKAYSVGQQKHLDR